MLLNKYMVSKKNYATIHLFITVMYHQM